jgi:class 3 adenylate cyclase
MFSHLLRSTTLSSRMDLEDLREVISAYQNAQQRRWVTFGGFVAKYMGDGALVYFGYPHVRKQSVSIAHG